MPSKHKAIEAELAKTRPEIHGESYGQIYGQYKVDPVTLKKTAQLNDVDSENAHPFRAMNDWYYICKVQADLRELGYIIVSEVDVDAAIDIAAVPREFLNQESTRALHEDLLSEVHFDYE